MDAAVVGEKNDDGVIAESGIVDGVDEAADGLIETFAHGGVHWVFLRRVCLDFGPVFFDHVRLGLPGGVYGEGPIAHVERLVAMVCDEC